MVPRTPALAELAMKEAGFTLRHGKGDGSVGGVYPQQS